MTASASSYHREENASSSQEEEDDVLVIGIDFGTTYSGVAWATSEEFKSRQINVIESWPGTGRDEGKTPTEIFYDEDKVRWGYDIPEDEDPVRWFKLLLLKDEDLGQELCASESILRAKKMLRKTKKTAVDLVADYLREIFKYVISVIVKSRGMAVVDAMRFHVVITVPAIWKGYAREDVRVAAGKAGILKSRMAGDTILTLAPEPEVAALATLSEPGRGVKKDETYIICDAGGGTVDLISYKIEQIKPIAMREAVEGTGSLCGGIFIDEAFENMCQSRLGPRWTQLSGAGIKKIMKNEWEMAIKPQFEPCVSPKDFYIVSVPAEAFRGSSLDDSSKDPIIKSGNIYFKKNHIQEAFAESLSGICRLIDNQMRRADELNSKITGIILVGGLGASPYLSRHLQDRYSKSGIKVLQSDGMKPRTAICRGAVHKGFLNSRPAPGNALVKVNGRAPIRVTSTVSRSSYGVTYLTDYDANLHLREDRVWNEDFKKWRAKNQIHWYLKRGDNVSEKRPVRERYHEIHKEDFGGRFSIDVRECEEAEVPDRCTHQVNKLCKIDCRLDVPFSSLPDIKIADGTMAKKMVYEVEMIPSGASMDFNVYINGRRQGSQTASVKF